MLVTSRSSHLFAGPLLEGPTPAVALLELIEHCHPSWHQQAACRGQGPGPWFPAKGEPPTAALKVCARCPVRDECAQAGGAQQGIWGGLSDRARRRQRQAASLG